jgi:hypothetical protein
VDVIGRVPHRHPPRPTRIPRDRDPGRVQQLPRDPRPRCVVEDDQREDPEGSEAVLPAGAQPLEGVQPGSVLDLTTADAAVVVLRSWSDALTDYLEPAPTSR